MQVIPPTLQYVTLNESPNCLAASDYLENNRPQPHLSPTHCALFDPPRYIRQHMRE
jgi:hypothetical protein